MQTTLLETPLYSYYQENNIKLVDFSGWALPIQFTQIKEEHLAVRNSVGLFETSHMGEILVSGPNSQEWLNGIVSNDLNKITTNQAQYHLILNENGYILDDLIIYKISDTEFMLTPNASNKDKILDWLKQHNINQDISIEDQSLQYGLLALQGPYAEKVLQSLLEIDLSSIKTYHFTNYVSIEEYTDIIISRTGYTGEDGFELYIPWNSTLAVYNKIIVAGQPYDIKPCGLGARDTLRLEAGLPLYGQDLSESIHPLEAGLSFAVKLAKESEFIGQKALQSYKDQGLKRKLLGFELLEKGIARSDYPVFNHNKEEIGYVTSGTLVPNHQRAIGLALLDQSIKIGDEVLIQIRQKFVPAIITKRNHLI